jgi:general secretion pathway protein J
MSPRPSGFTLLEVLVGLVVFGCLIAGLAQGVDFGLLAWRTQTRIESASGDLESADRALRQLIAQMDPGDAAGSPPLAARPNAVGFVTDLPDAAGALPQRRVEAELLVDGAHRLVLRWRPFRHAARLRPPPPMTETVLLDGVAQLQLAYLEPTGAWAGSVRYPGLPPLVRLRLLFVAGDPRHWPDIVVAPRLDPR